MKVLVRAANWIGDAIMSLPALRALAERFPEAQIDVLAHPWVADLYHRERHIHRTILLAGRNGARDYRVKWQQSRELALERYDLAVLFPNSFESALLLKLARISRIVGYNRDGRRFLLTEPIARPQPGQILVHQRFYYLELLRRAGIIAGLPPAPTILLEGIDQSRERGKEIFERWGIELPVIGVSPGAAYGGAKRWLPERFAEAARQIARKRRHSIAIFGSAAEAAICQDVADLSGGFNFAGKTNLRDYVDLTAACSVFLANDSGAMHVAYASGVPSVTIFGPTNELETGPTGFFARTVRQPVECSPCMLRECPIDHRCMTRVTSERVAEEALGIMSNSGLFPADF